jgi:RHS repeat-associated protein
LLAGAPAASAQAHAVSSRTASAPRLPRGVPARDVHVLRPRHVRHPVVREFRATETSWPAPVAGTARLAAPAVAAPPALPGQAPPLGALPLAAPAVRLAGSPVWAQQVPVAGAGHAVKGLQVRVLPHPTAVAAGVRGVMFTARAAGRAGGQVRLGISYATFSQVSGGNYGLSLGLFELPACALSTPGRPACETEKRLEFVNNWRTQSVSAVVSVPGAGTGAASSGLVLAAAPAQTDGGGLAGTYSATPLRASGTWTEGGASGSFDYSYPMTVPPAAGGLTPELGLDYDSGEVDGQTAATQEQASWVGDGWSIPQSYIAQSFTPCADDPEGSASPKATEDECYDGPILTLSQDGTSTPLICPVSTFGYSKDSTCTASDDEGQVITHHVLSGNGTTTKFTDYWTITDRDSTTYYYGLNELPGYGSGDQQTDSVDWAPVFSAHSADPCYSSTWADSVCKMAYQWNLDYVTDLQGNAMAYYYDRATNAYDESGVSGAQAVPYISDSYLDHIGYGFTEGNAYSNNGNTPDEVVFGASPRCVATTCPSIGSDPSDYPDVPYTQDYCAQGATNCKVTGPTFWSTMRLTSITTEQLSGSSYQHADSWALAQLFPSNGDGTAPALWLSTITHTGADTTAAGPSGGSAVTLPSVSFWPQSLPNRVDQNKGPALDRNRIYKIITETGSVIIVSYEVAYPCTIGDYPAPSDNHTSCFPIYWGIYGSGNPDWFYSYAVQSVSQSDPTGQSNGLYTSYSYKSPAWHYDDNLMVEAKDRTYGQWRGYGDVITETGTGTDAPTESETTYYQGMSNDDGSGSVTLTDSQGTGHDDADQLAGNALETTDYDYAGGPVEDSTIYSYWVSPAVATGLTSDQDTQTANATGLVEKWSRQAITDTGTTTWRVTETDTSYDATSSDADFGLPLYVFAQGDIPQLNCTSTTYTAPNTSENLVGLVAETEVDAAPCSGSSPDGASGPTSSEINSLGAPIGLSRPADVISDTRTYYDDPPILTGGLAAPSRPAWPQAAPANGEPSVVQEATNYTDGAFTYITQTATAYDSYGRPLVSYDANGNETTTSYTMTSESTTAETVTNPLGQPTATTYDPLRGIPLTITDPNGVTTTLWYDGLGRLIDVWGYGRPTTDPANEMYGYDVSATEPSVVTTQQLAVGGGGYIVSTTLYDALLRVRQTQTPTPEGGTLVSDSFYDTRGWLYKTNTGWWDSSASPSGSLLQVGDSDVADQHEIDFDGLGRPVLDIDYDDSSIRSETATAYYGDRVTTVTGYDAPATTPPSVETGATSTVTNAAGQATELDRYTSAPTVSVTTSGSVPITSVTISGGTTRATDYSYNARGELGTITDAASGEQWGKTYNLLGQITGTTDPNGGASTMTYDNNGNLATSTDADGHTISYIYDALNRKTGEYDGPTSASPPIASWDYDNSNNAVPGMANPIGQLTTETSYSGGNAYTIQQAGFNPAGESLGETVMLPSSEGELAGNYALTATYDPDTGLPLKTAYPASPDGEELPAETTLTGYNTLNQPIGLNSTLAGYVESVTYNASSQVQVQTLGNSDHADEATVTDTYDPNTGNLLTSQVAPVVNPSDNPPFDATSYSYDASGDMIAETDTRNGTQTETQCFDYNTLDQLTQAWTATDDCAADPASNNGATVGDGVPGGAYWSSWVFNPLGQRTSETDYNLTGGKNTVTGYSYNGNGDSQPNTLTGTSTTSPSGTSTASYSYDPDGNTVTRDLPAGNQKLTWTDDGKLATDTTSAGTTSYVYDADGNVLLQKDPSKTTLYLFGGTEQIVLTGTGPSQAVTGTRFIPLPGGGEAVRTGAGTDYSFELANQQGTGVLTLSNDAQAPQWQQYTPYGAPRGTPPESWPDTNGFLGKPTDASTGLTILGARLYDPGIGQFLSLDPLQDPTAPATLNGYTYANGNPTTLTDPTGAYVVEQGNPGCTAGDPTSAACTSGGGEEEEEAPILADRVFTARSTWSLAAMEVAPLNPSPQLPTRRNLLSTTSISINSL